MQTFCICERPRRISMIASGLGEGMKRGLKDAEKWAFIFIKNKTKTNKNYPMGKQDRQLDLAEQYLVAGHDMTSGIRTQRM